MARRSVQLDLDTACWLAGRSGGRADLDWSRLEPVADEVFPPLLADLLTGTESDAIDAPELASREVIDAVRGAQTSLAWLLGALRRTYPRRVARGLWRGLALPLAVERERWPGVLLSDGPARKALRPLDRSQGREVLRAARRVGLACPEWLPEAIHGNSADVLEYGLGGRRRVALWFRRIPARRAVAASWASMLVEDGRPAAVGRGRALPTGIVGELWVAPAGPGALRRIAADHGRVLRRLCPDADLQLRPAGRRPRPGLDEERLGALACRVISRRFPDRRRIRTASLAALAGEFSLPASWTAAQRRAAAPFGVLLAGTGAAVGLSSDRRRSLLALAGLKGATRESEYLERAARSRWFFEAAVRAARGNRG